jgi:transcription initiation factor TFIIIB Brf1 subunit/transcription initiation factor TFIIB
MGAGGPRRQNYSYRNTSAGKIRVALRAGYSVARKLIKIAAAAIQMACTQCVSNGT